MCTEKRRANVPLNAAEVQPEHTQLLKAFLCVWMLRNDFMTNYQAYEISSMPSEPTSPLVVPFSVSHVDSPTDRPF